MPLPPFSFPRVIANQAALPPLKGVLGVSREAQRSRDGGGSVWQSVSPVPVGAIHESPADTGKCPIKRAAEGVGPYGCGRTFSRRGDSRIARELGAQNGQTGRRGARGRAPTAGSKVLRIIGRGQAPPLQGRSAFPRRGDPCGRPRTKVRVRQTGRGQAPPLRRGRTFPVGVGVLDDPPFPVFVEEGLAPPAVPFPVSLRTRPQPGVAIRLPRPRRGDSRIARRHG